MLKRNHKKNRYVVLLIAALVLMLMCLPGCSSEKKPDPKDSDIPNLEKIADYTVKCIKNTQDDESHWYGVKFEPVLKDLIDCL